MNKPSLLIVDDEQSIVTELEILLCRDYEVYGFTDPLLVEQFLEDNYIDLIICDEIMPEMRGSELLGRIHKKYPDMCKIVLSGQAERDDVVKAVNEGHIFSFLFKPINRRQLSDVIEKGVEHRRMKLVLKRQNQELQDVNRELEEKVRRQADHLLAARSRLEQIDENKMTFLLYLSQEMNASLERIKRLAHTVISYFGIAGGELTVRPDLITCKEEVEAILQSYGELIGARELVVDNKITSHDRMRFDRNYSERVLRTLIHNSLIFSRKGGGVTIAMAHGDGLDRFMVADTGRGLTEDELPQIFKPFVIPVDKRNPEGFGLNLPLAKIIVEAHGGTITADSEGPERGSTFIVELPREGSGAAG